MKYFFLFLFLISMFSCVQTVKRLPKSMVLIQKDEMPNKYFISRHLNYDDKNRLVAWTDSTYSKNGGGIIVENSIIKYSSKGDIDSIMSYKNGQLLSGCGLSYEGNLIKIQMFEDSNESEKYKNPSFIELDKHNRAISFVSNIHNRSQTTSFDYDKQGNVLKISNPYYKKEYVYGDGKGVCHDVDIPSWFWVLTENFFQGIQLYKNDVHSVTTVTYSPYSKYSSSEGRIREVVMEFDDEGYPILAKGIITNGYQLKIDYLKIKSTR